MATPVAGWYNDPTGRFRSRYWDGVRWTDAVNSGGANGHDPMPEGAATIPPAPQTRPVAAPVAAPVPQPTMTGTAPPQQRSGGSPTGIAIGAIVAVVAVVLIIILVVNSGDSDDSDDTETPPTAEPTAEPEASPEG